MSGLIVVFELTDDVPHVDEATGVSDRLDGCSHLRPNLELITRSSLHCRIGVHDDSNGHVQQNEADEELEEHNPGPRPEGADSLHIFHDVFAHEHAPTHHEGSLLRSESLDLATEHDVAHDGEHNENDEEDDHK